MAIRKFCDRCNVEINEENFIKRITTPSYNFFMNGYKEITLCKECKKDLERFMKNE